MFICFSLRLLEAACDMTVVAGTPLLVVVSRGDTCTYGFGFSPKDYCPNCKRLVTAVPTLNFTTSTNHVFHFC